MYAAYSKVDGKIKVKKCQNDHNHKRETKKELLNKLKIDDISSVLLNRSYELFVKGDDPSEIFINLAKEFSRYV